MSEVSDTFNSKGVSGLLRSAPDLKQYIKNVEDMFEKPEDAEQRGRVVGTRAGAAPKSSEGIAGSESTASGGEEEGGHMLRMSTFSNSTTSLSENQHGATSRRHAVDDGDENF